MNIEPMKFKEFGGSVVISIPGKPARNFVPGGRMRGEPLPPPPPPTFSEEEIKSAEREAYKKGFLEGQQEGRRQAESEQAAVDRDIVKILESFTKSAAPLIHDYKATSQQLQEDMPKAALAIARKVAGAALADNAASAVEDIALRCVETMVGEPRLIITVNARLAERIERRMTQLAELVNSATDIQVSGDANLAMEDCRIEWKHGAFARHTGQLWQEIERVVESMIASQRHHASTHLNTLEANMPQANETAPDKKE